MILILMITFSITSQFQIVNCYPTYQDTYKVGVVDYKPLRERKDSTFKVIEKNVEKYVELIEKASMKGVDILVFPEHGLTTEECSMAYYPFPIAYSVYTNDTQLPDDTVFCYESDYNDNFRKLSCASKANNIYTVIPMIEEVILGENKRFYYFTSVVFTNQGTVAQTYRRKYLSNDEKLSYKPSADTYLKSFSLPNGQKVGLSSGLDFLYINESEILNEINAVIVTSSEQLKYSTDGSFHSGFAVNNDVTVIGASLLKFGGGGIYTPNSILQESDEDNLIIQEIPLKSKRESPKDHQITLRTSKKLSLKIDYDLNSFPNECIHNLDDEEENCKIVIDFLDLNSKDYFKKVTCFEKNTLWNESELIETCALFSRNQNQLKNISIVVKYNKNNIIQAIPVASSSNMLPSGNYRFERNEINIKMETTKENLDLIFFGIILINKNEEIDTTSQTMTKIYEKEITTMRNNSNIIEGTTLPNNSSVIKVNFLLLLAAVLKPFYNMK